MRNQNAFGLEAILSVFLATPALPFVYFWLGLNEVALQPGREGETFHASFHPR
jgi:hypothetical protein